MAGNRMGRINEEVQRELAALLRSVKDPRVSGRIVSVTAVEVTGDLRHAKVFVSPMDGGDDKELMRGLRSASGWLRRETGSRLQLRNTPELHFELDDSLKKGAQIFDILNSLNISAEEDGAEDGDGRADDED